MELNEILKQRLEKRFGAKTTMEENLDYLDPETVSLIRRYEKMLRNEEHLFFDVDEFEDILESVLIEND